MIRLFILCIMLSYSSVNYANKSVQNNILILGDSLSTSYGLEAEKGWVSLLERKLIEENLPFQIINASISGETTIGGRNRLQKLLVTYQPVIVFIELGGNDGLRGLPLKVIRTNLQSMIDEALNNSAQVLLAGIKIPPNYGPKYTELFTGNYHELQKLNSIHLIPFFLEGVAGHKEYMQSDGIHPNDKAQPIIFEMVWKHLLPMLPGKS